MTDMKRLEERGMAEMVREADELLMRCEDKMRRLVIQNGGRYDGGEAIQFILPELTQWRAKCRALAGGK